MNRILVKVLRSGSAASLLIGLSYSQGLAAPMTNKQTEKPAAATDASERVTPEEAKRRKDWTFAMHRKATPKKGCFSADYPYHS